MENEKENKIVESQISFAVNKYAAGRNPHVVRAEAEHIAKEALKTYRGSSSGLKTYLSVQLQKMSRTAYKSTSPISIPENRLMLRSKYRKFLEAYRDEHGFSPSDSEISAGIKVPIKEGIRFKQEGNGVRNEEAYVTNKEKEDIISPSDIIRELPPHLAGIGMDFYHHQLPMSKILKKYKIKKTLAYKQKKELDLAMQLIARKRQIGHY